MKFNAGKQPHSFPHKKTRMYSTCEKCKILFRALEVVCWDSRVKVTHTVMFITVMGKQSKNKFKIILIIPSTVKQQ